MAKTKEQMQIMVLGAILAAGALVAAVYFGLVPLINSYQASRDAINDLERKMETARSFMQNAPRFRTEYREALSKIQQYSDHIPQPVLGNYLLAMETSLKQCLEGLDVDLQDIGDGGIDDLAPGSLFQFYKVRMNVFAGIAELAGLFDNISKMNPLISITDLSINPDEKNPMKHRISFNMSWMIWKTPFEMPDYITNPPLLEEEAKIPEPETEQEEQEEKPGEDSE